MTKNILLKFAKKGINLSPDAYKKVMASENPVNFASELIVKLKGGNFKPGDLISVDGDVIDEITGNKTAKTTADEKDKGEFKTFGLALTIIYMDVVPWTYGEIYFASKE